MAKSQTNWLIIAALIVVVILIVLLWPKGYLTEEVATNLQPGDTVVIEDQTYTFQSTEATDDTSTTKLIFTDSSGASVYIAVPPTTTLVVKRTMRWWNPAPPPVPPQAVPVPVPVPVPTAPVPTTPSPSPTPTPTPPTPTPTPQPLPPGVSAVCGNGVVETGEQCEPPNTSTCNANCQIITPTYPATCYDGIWNGDESDLDCGGSCPKCLSTGIYTSCWVNSDCQSNNCDMSGAQTPLPTGYTIQTLRQLAGQHWIIPYSGICR